MHVLFNLIFPEQSHIFMKAANQTKKNTIQILQNAFVLICANSTLQSVNSYEHRLIGLHSKNTCVSEIASTTCSM